MSKQRILLVEDDRTIAMGIEYSLDQANFETVVCYDATSTREIISSSLKEIDCCLLDLALPDGSGYDLCRLIKMQRDIPVIFLTAQDDEVNVVMGLDMGADDYITKPFRIRELISRIKSVLRRYEKQATGESASVSQIAFGPLSINLSEATVAKAGREIALTAVEYRLLLVFANHRGQILSRTQLLDQIWDMGGAFINDNTLTVYIKRLREKLEDNPSEPRLIETVRGLGYKAGD